MKRIFPFIGAAAVAGIKRLYAIPMVGIAMAMYLAYYVVGVGSMMDAVAFSPSFSGVEAPITIGNCLVLIACGALTLEMGKAADAAAGGLADMILSIILCVISWLCLFNLSGFASATWLILTALQTADAIGNSIVAVKASRRDYGVPIG